MAITQVGRLLRLVTPLGEDVLLAESVNGVEGLSTPFSFSVACVAEVASRNHLKVNAKDLLGEIALLEFQAVGKQPRVVHGIIRSLRAGPVDEKFAHFNVEIVPRLALAELGSNCRIFENLTVTDIVEQVLGLYKLDLKIKISRPEVKLDFVVQYRETDFNFISRLLERDGYFYFFEHTARSHVMVITDTLPATPNPLQDAVELGGSTPPARGGGFIDEWQEHQQLAPHSVIMRDHHFEMPRDKLIVAQAAQFGVPATGVCELYDYPGEYALRFNQTGQRLREVQQVGDFLAKVRVEEIEAAHLQIAGGSTCAAFIPGFVINVTSIGNQKVKGKFVLTQVQHSATQSPGYTGSGFAGAGGYQNRFTCLPEQSTFHPPRLARKPSIAGPQTARVMAEVKGEEVGPDKFGRVKVFFPWDRDQKAAGRVRVAQQRAGKQGGFIWIPREGDEVIVAFLEGDPDCPIIVGSVYNADNPVPYTLPEHQTQSGIKTRSTPGGGADNFNELRFEDKKGAEEIHVQAERNLTTLVKASEARDIGGSRTTTVHQDDTRTIKKGDDILTVETGSRHATIEQNDILEVKAAQTIVVGKKHALQVKEGDHLILVDGGNSLLDVAQGNLSIKTGAGKIELTAETEITLKVGSNSIKIDKQGITIKGIQIKLEADAAFSAKGKAAKVEGSVVVEVIGGTLAALKADGMVQVQSSGVTMVKGSATMIN